MKIEMPVKWSVKWGIYLKKQPNALLVNLVLRVSLVLFSFYVFCVCVLVCVSMCGGMGVCVGGCGCVSVCVCVCMGVGTHICITLRKVYKFTYFKESAQEHVWT